MYLKLMNEEQKSAFLEEAYILAQIDGTYTAEEKAMLEAYAAEAELPLTQEMKEVTREQVKTKIRTLCGTREHKIIIFELLGMALADADYSEKERETIEELAETLGLGRDFSKACEEKISSYLRLQESINSLVLE